MRQHEVEPWDVVEPGEVTYNQGSYITGFIGAILGGIVGTLPTVLAELGLERIYAILYALIPICAYYGYKIFRGRMNRGAFACTLISAVLNLLSIQFFELYISFSRLYDMVLSPVEMASIYWRMLLSGDLTGELITSVVFLVLGLWFSWGIITRTAARGAKPPRQTEE